ncbi:ferrous iron transport protein B [Halosquirtibacter xylanolyticus]|uniref:ferrous iron transport protein B n=1 Tax=Halosquirtibacter xylanolyticus TaxID=3374599 RepID=UPI0037480D65|nr:ferrous iron transport protein B [Prolixibacteraceae bacterium]
MHLSEVSHNQKVYVESIGGDQDIKQRLYEHGISKGTELIRIKSAPLQDPVEFKVGGNHLFIRKNDLAYIQVTDSYVEKDKKKKLNTKLKQKENQNNSKEIKVALVGHPNSGKSTIFNRLTKSNVKIANYNGVTVEVKRAKISFGGYDITFIDLPGLYSMSPYSPEEIATRDLLLDERPDMILNIVNHTNLEKDLVLTMELMELEIPTILVLNMKDEFDRLEGQMNYMTLSETIQMKVVTTNGKAKNNRALLLESIVSRFEENSYSFVRPNYTEDIEKQLASTGAKASKEKTFFESLSRIESIGTIEKIKEQRKEFISQLLLICGYKHLNAIDYKTVSQKIDEVVTNKYIGLPLLLLLMTCMFYVTFSLGAYPADALESLIAMGSHWIDTVMFDGVLKDFLLGGIVQGIGAVLVFLPSILILFFFTTLFEDSGYMARAIFIVDRVMKRWGLQGNAFVPLLMGFGCNVPAIMATRTIKQTNERIRTMLVVPLMSCSARIPVYILFTASLFSNYRTIIIIGLYLLGIIIGLIVSKILQKSILPSTTTPFIYELPPYRMPSSRNMAFQLWDKTRNYLQKIGTTILLGVILIWTLSYISADTKESEWLDFQMAQLDQSHQINIKEKDNYSHSEWLYLEGSYMKSRHEYEVLKQKTQLESSALGQIGQWMVPVMKPLGFDWKMSVALLAGVSAKEIVVSTLGILYQIDTVADGEMSLTHVVSASLEQNNDNHQMAILSGISFLIFILIYFPCLGVLSSIKAETSSWGWAIFTLVYTSGLAYLLSLMVFQIGKLFI